MLFVGCRVQLAALICGGVLVIASTGCDRKKEYAGIGPWLLNKTTRSEVGGLCKSLESGILFCYGGPLSKRSFTIPGHEQQADVSLYFRSDEPSAPLIEIEIDQHKCEPLAMQSWVGGKFGKVVKSTPEKMTWQGRYAFTALVVKPNERLCKLHIVQLADASRIKELQ